MVSVDATQYRWHSANDASRTRPDIPIRDLLLFMPGIVARRETCNIELQLDEHVRLSAPGWMARMVNEKIGEIITAQSSLPLLFAQPINQPLCLLTPSIQEIRLGPPAIRRRYRYTYVSGDLVPNYDAARIRTCLRL